MTRHRKIDTPANGIKQGNGDVNKSKSRPEPLKENKNKGPLRILMHNGALVAAKVSGDEHIKILNEGKLGENWVIKKKGIGSRPEAVGYADVEGIGIVRICIEITDGSFFRLASNTLREAGVSEDFVKKVGEIEIAMNAGEHDLVDELINGPLDPGPALGGIEDAFIRHRKKDKDSD